MKGGPSCSPACNLKQTCTSGNCRVAKETPFTECALQDDADDTMVDDDDDYEYQYSSSDYGDAECNKFIVDVVPGAHNWERIEAQTNYVGITECECRAHDMYLKVRGIGGSGRRPLQAALRWPWAPSWRSTVFVGHRTSNVDGLPAESRIPPLRSSFHGSAMATT